MQAEYKVIAETLLVLALVVTGTVVGAAVGRKEKRQSVGGTMEWYVKREE